MYTKDIMIFVSFWGTALEQWCKSGLLEFSAWKIQEQSGPGGLLLRLHQSPRRGDHWWPAGGHTEETGRGEDGVPQQGQGDGEAAQTDGQQQ